LTTPLSESFPDPPEIQGGLLRFVSPVWFSIITLCLIFFLYQVVGGVLTFFITGASITEENIDAARWLTLGGQLLFILVPTLVLTGIRHGPPGGFFPVRGVKPGELVVVFVSVFALQQVLQGYMFLQEAIPVPDSLEHLVAPYKEMIEQTYRVLVTADSLPEFLFVLLVVAIVPALVEELLFRGLIQTNLGKVFTGVRAALAAGVVFAAYHLVPFTFVPLAILGIFFGYLFYRTGNLTLAIAAHFFNNLIACLAVYLSLEEDFVAISPAGQAPLLLILVNSMLFLLLFFLSFRWFLKMTAKPVPADAERPV
jgi:membrane protease YdiL (CAAX protease family)